MKVRNILKILSFVCCLTSNLMVYSKDYVVYQNGAQFEEQLSRIMNDINRIPNEEPIVIRIEAGYYSISKTVILNGGEHHVTIIGAKRKPTVISGSIAVEGWQQLPNGLWRSRVPESVQDGYLPDQLFVNGVRAIRSRTPNRGAFAIEDGFIRDALCGVKLKSDDLASVQRLADKDVPCLTIYQKWNSSKRFLSYISKRDSTLCFSGKQFPSYNKLEKGGSIVVENTINGIDTEREWCVDKAGYIYYMPKNDEIIERCEFRLPIVEKLLEVKSDGGITIKNIVFEHTTMQMPSDGFEYMQAACEMSAAIEIDNTDKLLFENCEVRNVANYGIWVRKGCGNSQIRKTYFHDLGGGAIKIGTLTYRSSESLTNHITIENNIVRGYGGLMEEAVGIILFNASDCRIIHNSIYDGNYSGISLGWAWGYRESPSKNNEVAYNRLSNIGKGLLRDMGAIYTLGRSEGTSIHHNVISDVITDGTKGWGIYLDEGTTGVSVRSNVVYNTTAGGFFQHYGSGNIVTNNVFAWGEKGQIIFSTEKGEVPLLFAHNIVLMKEGALFSGRALNSEKIVIENNCYWSISSELPKAGNDDVTTWIERKDTESVYQDPGFRNPQNGDFRFKSKTACRAIGFKPFDYTKAGVYGSRKWRKLAKSPLQ